MLRMYNTLTSIGTNISKMTIFYLVAAYVKVLIKQIINIKFPRYIGGRVTSCPSGQGDWFEINWAPPAQVRVLSMSRFFFVFEAFFPRYARFLVGGSSKGPGGHHHQRCASNPCKYTNHTFFSFLSLGVFPSWGRVGCGNSGPLHPWLHWTIYVVEN